MSDARDLRSVPDGPVAQSIAIAFKVLFAAIAVLAVVWAGSNWRQVPADAQAIVLRFKRIVGVKQAGLTLSWPRPIGDVALVPGEQRLLTVRTAWVARVGGQPGYEVFTVRPDGTEQPASRSPGHGGFGSSANIPDGSGEYLTGDGGVVLVGATVNYRVSDAAAYYLAQEHVPPALLRLLAASAINVLASRKLDDVMVAEPVGARANVERAAEAESRRQALRGDLVAAVNHRLADLAAHGAALGVEVARIDVDVALPPQAKVAYDGVLVAMQTAEQGIADARTEAARVQQLAERERDRVLEAAKASAQERIAEARAHTSAILAVRASMTPATRGAVLDQVYRDQIATLLQKVGRITAVDTRGGERIILPAEINAPPVLFGR